MTLAAHTSGPVGAPVALWLHGFLGEGADWLPTCAALPGWRHVCVDLPGHGASPSLPEGADPWAWTLDQLTTLLRAQGVGPFALVGYSLGARVAMALAPRLADQAGPPSGDRLHAAVLISGHPGLPPTERAARLALDEARAQQLLADGLAAFVAGWYRFPLLATLDRADGADAIKRRRSHGDATARARTLVGLSTGRQGDLLPALRPLAPRLTWVAGADDARYTDLLRAAHERTPGSRLHVVAGAGHHVHLEQPAAMVAVLRRALGPADPAHMPTSPHDP